MQHDDVRYGRAVVAAQDGVSVPGGEHTAGLVSVHLFYLKHRIEVRLSQYLHRARHGIRRDEFIPWHPYDFVLYLGETLFFVS